MMTFDEIIQTPWEIAAPVADFPLYTHGDHIAADNLVDGALLLRNKIRNEAWAGSMEQAHAIYERLLAYRQGGQQW